MINLLQKLNSDIIATQKEHVKGNEFRLGDILLVKMKTAKNKSKRISFIGKCISYVKKGLSSSITLRNVIAKENIEFTFPIYSPLINNIQVVQINKQKERAKLYYLRLKGSAKATKY